MNLKAVIFDLDGTIADTVPLTVYSLKEITRELTGKLLSDEEILAEFGPIDTDIIRKLVDDNMREQSVEMYINHFRENFDKFVKPIDGMEALLRYLKGKGIKTGLFTGRSKRACDVVLEKLNIKQYFDTILAGDDTKKPKPDPEGILLTLKELGVKSSAGAYVGDFDVDILASKAAGTLSVLALWSSTGNTDNLKHNPDKHFKSTYEFVDWLEKEA